MKVLGWRRLGLAGFSLLLAGLVIVWVFSQPRSLSKAEHETGSRKPQVVLSQSGGKSVEEVVRTEATTRVSPIDHDEIVQWIEELSATAEVGAIAPLMQYLDHEEEAVRTVALEGLIQLGRREVIPELEARAARIDSEEAACLKAAADFLALPSLSEHLAGEN